MKCNKLAVYRVSSRAGNIKTQWVQEVRADGWIRVTPGQESHHDNHPGAGTWIAPHNVVTFLEPHYTYDYGGIKEGTLVQVWEGVGIVVRRRNATYDILIDGAVRPCNWESVRPVEDPCNEAG